jgi:hypothetical protein
VKALMDESSPEASGGIFYIVTAVVTVTDEADTKAALEKVLVSPGRRRPFHWVDEGPTARDGMIRCLVEVGATAHVAVHYPTARSGIEAARARCISDIVPRVLREGATELLIESRNATMDAGDRAVILDILAELNLSGQVPYGHGTKQEPLLWLADAVCGVVGEYVQRREGGPFAMLETAGVVGLPVYLTPQKKPPEKRKSRFPS